MISVFKRFSFRKLLHNWPLALSGAALALLCFAPSNSIVLIVTAVLFAVFISGCSERVFECWKKNISILNAVLTVLLAYVIWFRFCFKVLGNGETVLTRPLSIGSMWVSMVIGALLAVIGSYGLSAALCGLSCVARADSTDSLIDDIRGDRGENRLRLAAVVFITAIITVTVCSKSSPLYPFNDWGDANCFFTVGRSMLHGVLPYRDLIEQKGPILYFIHSAAALISERSFFGVYLVEILSAAVFLFFGFKIMRLYDKKAGCWMIPVLAAVTYSAASFAHGDSAEELCLPLYSFAIYLVLRFFREKKLPSAFESFMLGITSGAILWIKYTMLGLYLGVAAVTAVILAKQKNIKSFIKMCIWVIAGVVSITIPVLLYFGANNALGDLFKAYFYNNLFLYTKTSDRNLFLRLLSLFDNIRLGLRMYLIDNLFIVVTCILGILALKKQKRGELKVYSVLFISAFLLIYIGGRHYKYYSFILAAFVPAGAIVLSNLLKLLFAQDLPLFKKKVHALRTAAAGLSLICLLTLFAGNNNTYLLKYKKEELPQYRFADIISKTENATLMNYGFLDGGFYTAAGIIPDCRVFCHLNLLLDLDAEQNSYIIEGRTDYIVTRDQELTADNYSCVDICEFFYEGKVRVYRLYRKN